MYSRYFEPFLRHVERATNDTIRNPKPAADAARPALDGMRKLPDPIGTNVPTNAENFARVNAAVQVGGGLLLATGKMPRLASAALAFTVIPGSLGGHMFWNQTDPQRKADERRAFMTDLSLLGGLIIAAVDTEGKPSLGWRGRRAARKVSEAVTAALPVGAASGGALADSAFAEKLGQGLHAARERGAELADVARERALSTRKQHVSAPRASPRSPANGDPRSRRLRASAPPNWPTSRANAPRSTPTPRGGAPPSWQTLHANAPLSSQKRHGTAPKPHATWQATGRTTPAKRAREARPRSSVAA